MCAPLFTHAHKHIHTRTHTHYGWQGKCGESHPVRHHCRASGRVDTNYSQPDRAKHCFSPPAAPPSGRRNPPPQPPTPLFSLPGSVAFPLVIAVRWPAMCYKWDKLQRLGDVRVGGCEWVAMAAGSQGARGRDGRLGLWVWERKMGSLPCVSSRMCVFRFGMEK